MTFKEWLDQANTVLTMHPEYANYEVFSYLDTCESGSYFAKTSKFSCSTGHYAENSVVNDEICEEAVHDTKGPYEPAHNAILIYPR